MSTALPPPKKAGPTMPPKALPPGNGAGAKPGRTEFRIQSGISANQPHRIAMYGPGGVGKTELASLLKNVGINPLFIDLEDGTRFLPVDRIGDVRTFDDLRACLQSNVMDSYDAVIIDSATKAEEMSIAWTLDNVKTEKGNQVTSIEGYGWGKGYVHVYETFLFLLADLDALTRKGKHVVLICHDCTASVPNPGGDDWIRYEPRLQSNKSASIRNRVKEWADHLFYIGFDVESKNGKGIGSGTRTIYPVEMPTHWAKSRSLADPVPYIQGIPDLWEQLFGKEK